MTSTDMPMTAVTAPSRRVGDTPRPRRIDRGVVLLASCFIAATVPFVAEVTAGDGPLFAPVPFVAVAVTAAVGIGEEKRSVAAMKNGAGTGRITLDREPGPDGTQYGVRREDIIDVEYSWNDEETR